MAAESGLMYLVYVMRQIDPAAVQGDSLLDKAHNHLLAVLDGSPAIQGSIGRSGDVVTIPATLVTGQAGCFDVTVTPLNPTTLHIRSTGHHDSLARSVGINFALANGASAFFDYGIAARGPIRMTGNASVEGYNEPAEARCLSATYSTTEVFDLTGNCGIQGGLSVANPDGYVKLTGNVDIAGQRFIGSNTITKQMVDEDPSAYPGFSMGTGEVEFPEVDPTVFEPFATTVVDASTNTSGNKTFTNIRIKANTNKTFAGNINLNGVIFIEQPNRIHFSGNVNITGVIVTQDAGDGAYESNTLKFTGNLSARGVEELPDTPEFSQLRQMPGSFILAPGFGCEFTGNFGTVNGTIAADKFKWTGNASGVVRGSVISYSDDEFKLTGNSRIRIDRSGTPDVPPGFNTQTTFRPMPDSYVEY